MQLVDYTTSQKFENVIYVCVSLALTQTNLCLQKAVFNNAVSLIKNLDDVYHHQVLLIDKIISFLL